MKREKRRILDVCVMALTQTSVLCVRIAMLHAKAWLSELPC